MNDDKNKKIVNTEEQNRAVNPGNRDNTTASEEPLLNTSNDSDQGEMEKPDGGSEVERPHRIEGDDAGSIERKIPNM